MKLSVADITLDDGRAASFIDKTDDDAIFLRNEKTHVLILEVKDFDDARELIETIERSQARKSKDKKVSSASPPPPQDPPPGSGGGARAEAPGAGHQEGPGADGSAAGAEGTRREQQQAPAGAQEKKQDRGSGAGRPAGGDAGSGAAAAPAAAKALYRCDNPDCRAAKRSVVELKRCPECGSASIHEVSPDERKPLLPCGGTNCRPATDGKPEVHPVNDPTCRRLRAA